MKPFLIGYLMHGAKNVGGGERSLYYLIKGLDKTAFTPIVFYAFGNEIIDKLQSDGLRTEKFSLDPDLATQFRDQVKLNPFNFISLARRIHRTAMILSRQLKENKIDLLHPHDNLSKLIGVLAAKKIGIKVVAHCRDLLNNSFIERFLLYFQMFLMDRIIAVSENNKELFKTRGRISQKVRTIQNGIDIKEFDTTACSLTRQSLGISEETFVIGMIGVLDPCKGHTILFDALKDLSKNRKNFVCLVGGDGRERVALQNYVSTNNLAPFIRFLGHRNDVPCLLKLIDVVTIPSLQESFPRVCLEAMASRVPVVASRIGGLPEMIEDGVTGLLVRPNDAAALKEALARLANDEKLRRLMGQASRVKVEQEFSIHRNVEETQKLYLELLGG